MKDRFCFSFLSLRSISLRLWHEAIYCSRVPPKLSASIFTLPYRFSFSFFLSNYRLSDLCFLVNAPQSVSPGLSGIGIKHRDGVSKRLTAYHNRESPLPWLVKKEKRKAPNPERCSVFLKQIVFHPCHRSK